jgi:hypothetical protein
MDDLIVLTADSDAEAAMKALLARPEALKIREISSKVIKHDNHDAGCRTDTKRYLRSQVKSFRHALVIFDLHGSGRETQDPSDLRTSVLKDLEQQGWGGRAEVIIFDPELEIWVWSSSRNVATVLGWQNQESLNTWLGDKGWVEIDPETQQAKPKLNQPKEALADALKQVQKKPVSSLFRLLAEKVSFQTCTDPSLQKLLTTLQTWFPPISPPPAT